jgi:NADH:ubiquinone oxidoreductase subunit H
MVSDVNVAVLVIFAVASMGVYGIVLAGWASNSKYSLLGGLRSSAQMISYELAYGMALATVVMMAGRCRCARSSIRSGLLVRVIPEVVHLPAAIGFFVFACAGVAETNRAPFDFPEAEQELVAGYHTEYSSMRFAMFFMAEYINMVTVSAVRPTCIWAAGTGPFIPGELRLDLVRDQARVPVVRVSVAALDAAAIPLRPADVVRVEGAVAGAHRQPRSHSRGGAVLWPLTPCCSTASRRSP